MCESHDDVDDDINYDVDDNIDINSKNSPGYPYPRTKPEGV